MFFLVLIYSLVVSINTQLAFTNTPDSAHLHPIPLSGCCFTLLRVLLHLYWCYLAPLRCCQIQKLLSYNIPTKQKQKLFQSQRNITSYRSNFVVINHLQNSHTNALSCLLRSCIQMKAENQCGLTHTNHQFYAH